MMKNIKILFLLLPAVMWGQELMTANPDSFTSIDGTIDEMLRVVNGEQGKKRNWEAFKNVFLESCNFTVVYNEQEFPFETASIDDMIDFMQDDYYDSGYKEEVLFRKTEEFHGIAHVFEVVQHTEPDGNKIKGLNSYQLVFDGKRWWIANTIWTAENEDHKIPEKFYKN